jgi:hypothetical protein
MIAYLSTEVDQKLYYIQEYVNQNIQYKPQFYVPDLNLTSLLEPVEIPPESNLTKFESGLGVQ